MGRKKEHSRLAAAFIFDLDGTLIDSGTDIALAANFALGHFQRPQLPQQTIIPYIGNGVAQLLSHCFSHGGAAASDEMLAEALAVFRDHYRRHCLDHTVPYQGVLATLARFHRIPLTIATHKPRDFTVQILQGLHLLDAFSRIKTLDDVPIRKPAPDLLQACLEGLTVPPGEVIVVGDNPHDIAAARAIGAVAVGAKYGLSTPGQIQSATPDYMISGFGELADLFRPR
jgi:phosphoglycolate phosphatase